MSYLSQAAGSNGEGGWWRGFFKILHVESNADSTKAHCRSLNTINDKTELELTHCREGIEIIAEVPTRPLLLPTKLERQERGEREWEERERRRTRVTRWAAKGSLSDRHMHRPGRHHSRAHLSANGGCSRDLFPVSSSSPYPSSSSSFSVSLVQ